jgi:hypothetical protein
LDEKPIKCWKSSQTGSARPVGVWTGFPAVGSSGRTISIVDAHRGDGARFTVRAEEKLTAFVELERQVLTMTFYLESIMPIRVGDQRQ